MRVTLRSGNIDFTAAAGVPYTPTTVQPLHLEVNLDPMKDVVALYIEGATVVLNATDVRGILDALSGLFLPPSPVKDLR